jgi:hypothetical protein
MEGTPGSTGGARIVSLTVSRRQQTPKQAAVCLTSRLKQGETPRSVYLCVLGQYPNCMLFMQPSKC